MKLQHLQQEHRHILVKPKEAERELISKLIDRALDSDYAVLVKLR